MWTAGWAGDRRWGSWFVFHVPVMKQNPTWVPLDYVFVSMPALSVMSMGTCTVVLWQGSSVGQDDGSQDGLGYVLPTHSWFHVSFIKTLIPKLVITFLALVTLYYTKQPFSLGNCVLHQKNLLLLKSQPIPWEPFLGFQIVASA